jgi:thiamine-phosphate pyrophosphorylase
VKSFPAGLYGIADASYGDPIAIGTALHEAGCAVIQLRAKGWATDELTEAGRALRSVCTRAIFIINDHVDVAKKVGADGVHLGQDDGCVLKAREILGPTSIIGKSTHTLAQVSDASAADYIGFGPVFGTQTKSKAGEPVGTELLAMAVQISTVAVVAIGGIDHSNLGEVQNTGVHSWAVIRALLGTESILRAVRQMESHT